ncbi:MAG: hypothetical protein ACLFVU_11550 [Phycisphaerae bacterium]
MANGFAKAGRWLDDHWVNFVLGTCSALFAASAVLISDEAVRCMGLGEDAGAAVQGVAFWVLVAAALINVIVFIFHLRRQKRMSVLEDELKSAQEEANLLIENVRNVIEGYLVTLADKRLDFGKSSDKGERVTLYVHDPKGMFVPVGRFSFDPRYREINRPTYPDDRGCIAEAWTKGRFFDNEFPDPDEDIDAYLEYHRNYGIGREEAEALVMRSRTFFGYRVLDTRNRDPLAVVIVESTSTDRLKKSTLERVFGDRERGFLSEMIETLRPHLSVPSVAEEAGL